VDAYWAMNRRDFEKAGLSRQQVIECVVGGGCINMWCALTPGEVQQSPLAVCDMSTFAVSNDDIATVPVVFPGLSDTLTLLRTHATAGVRFLWRPSMRFGEVLLFSTTSTPHSAVWLDGQPASRRVSAEIRILVVGRDGRGGIDTELP